VASIFYGRGENPNRGKIKSDIFPEDVTINIGKGEKVPSPPDGHKWGQVITNETLSWVANWKEPINKENKYIYFSVSGSLKRKSDMEKYEKARKLDRTIEKIRTAYTKDIVNKKDKVKKQLGTILYLIDTYGIRAGGEKNEEKEADTVGASTIRVEHVNLDKENIAILDFLGKDSIRFYKELSVTPEVYENFKLFCNKKNGKDQLFDLINANDVNSYLKQFDNDFSAKVFRTRLASTMMEDGLGKLKVPKTMSQDDKKAKFLVVNVSVAHALNHQKGITQIAKDSLNKSKSEIEDLKAEVKNLAKTKGSGTEGSKTKVSDSGTKGSKTDKDAKKIKSLKSKIEKKQNVVNNKTNLLDVAVNTSLMNYIDPRVVVSWTKSNNVVGKKIYSTALMKKFEWAFEDTTKDWKY